MAAKYNKGPGLIKDLAHLTKFQLNHYHIGSVVISLLAIRSWREHGLQLAGSRLLLKWPA